ncbi:MAG: hypothetical protein ACXADF_06995 [Candidatus Thorarchaeota archaeon]|jgi:hypothetical protein
MKLVEARLWLWINAITLIIFGAIAFVPEIMALIDTLLFSVVKMIVALITIFVAFLESDVSKVNSKMWLLTLGLILLLMGMVPFFPLMMGGVPELGNFLNTLKIVLGVLTFIVIYLDWMRS